MKIIYIILLCGVLCFIDFFQLHGQTVSPSAYTTLGVGRVENTGLVNNMGIGGSGIALPTDNYINVLNPASLTGVDSLKMLFDIGFGGNVTGYESKGESGTAISGGLNNISMAFRLAPRIGTGFGISQYSSVGYNIETTTYIQGTLTEIAKTYEESGGIDEVYLSNAIAISKNLSLGIKLSYLFGKIKKTELYSDDEIGGVLRLDYTDFLQQVQAEAGIQYKFAVKSNVFNIGAVYSPQVKFATSREIITASSSGAGISEDLDAKDYEIPTNVAFGLGWANKKGFRAVFDYRFSNWENIYYSSPVASYKDSHRFSGGLEYKNYNTKKASPYLWQIGGYYEDSYLKVQGNSLIDRGVTFGVGIPVRNHRSYVNMSLNYGVRGTIDNSLITENYYGFSLSMSMGEVWFRKRKFE